MDLFGFLAGASPWWWIAFALGLMAIEMLTFSFFLIWPGLAAVIVAVTLWIFPELSGTGQVLLFSGLSLVLSLAGRAWFLDRKPVSEVPGLNNRSTQLVGRTAVVIDGFDAGGLGNVEVDGIRWRARMADGQGEPTPGETLHVEEADGMTLILAPRA